MSRRAVLLLNLGSPDSASVSDVKKYLRSFLGDPRVLTLPFPLRKILLEGIILPFRSKKSAARYRKILTADGAFPLVAETENLRARVEKILAEEIFPDEKIPVFAAMRHGKPSVEIAAKTLVEAGVSEVFVVPLFPQRAASSWDSAVVHAREIFEKEAPSCRLKIIEPFFAAQGYIDALAGSVRRALYGSSFQKLLISFHGIPVRGNDAPSYRAECEATAAALADALDLSRERYEVAFQSRFGKGKWLEPATAARLCTLPREGHADVAVVAPGFITDCLETLEELAIDARQIFLSAGGKNFEFVSCLNADTAFARFLADSAKAAFSEGF